MAIIPIEDVRNALIKAVELDECQEENDSLGNALHVSYGVNNNLRAAIIDLRYAVGSDANIISDKQKIVELSDITIKKQARRIRLLKTERTGLGIITLAFALKMFLIK